jgi:hypothetical protein
MEMSGSDAGTKLSLLCGHNHVSGGCSFLIWQVHRIRGARIPLAFERRQTPFDCPDDVDQPVGRISFTASRFFCASVMLRRRRNKGIV